MKRLWKTIVIKFIMPILGMLMLSPFFVEHFYFRGNEYLINYQKGYALLLTVVLIVFILIALVAKRANYKQYNEEQIFNMRLGHKKNFITKFILRPAFWVLIIGLMIIGKWYIFIVYLLLKPVGALLSQHQKRILADYDKNREMQANGKVPLEANYEVIK